MSDYEEYADTFCIITSAPQHNTSTHSVNYYPDGDGEECYGYVTDFGQYKTSVSKNLTKEGLQFQFICPSTKQRKFIKSDGGLRDAVKGLDNRGVLLVTALKTSGKGLVDFEIEKKDAKVKAILEHFDLQGEVHCHHGGSMSKCNGVIYQYAYHSNYFLSLECYKALSDDEKEAWKAIVHWGGPVPSHDLSYEDNSDGVRMLQYYLTRFGFMKLEHTSQCTSWYLSRTQDAVSAFRKKFKVEGCDVTVYDKKTAKKLAEVVTELRKKGHKYL